MGADGAAHQASKGGSGFTLSSSLQLDDSASERDHGGLGPVLGTELLQDALDAVLDRLFGDTESARNLFVAAAICDEPQHRKLGRRERILACVLGDPEGQLRGQQSLPCVHRADRKSTRLNSSHSSISYAVFCLKKKKTIH